MSVASLPRMTRTSRPATRPLARPRRSSPPLRVVKAPSVGRRRARFVIAAGAVTAVLLFGVVTLQALVSQQSFDIQRAQNRVTELRQRADDLHLQVAGLSAPERIAKEAARLGMVLPEEVHALSLPAARPATARGGIRSSASVVSP